jgi:predicted TIM-barrel fold metal-dependent hydrolase
MELWDVNCMLGRWPSASLLFHDVPGLLARMDALGIARAAVSHTDCLFYDVVEGNAALNQALAQADPAARARLLPVWVLVPPATGEQGSPRELAAAMEREGIRLARLYPRDNNYSLSSPDAAELLTMLAERRTLTLIDLEQSSWEEIDRLAAAYPALPWAVCNIGYRGLRRLAGVLARRPNVHVDLSYLGSHQGLEWLVERVGAEHFLYGSGAPIIDGGGGATRLLLSSLSEADQAAISHGNFQRLLGEPLAAAAPSAPASVRAAPLDAETPAAQVLLGQAIHGEWDVLDAHAHVGPWFNFFTPEPSADSMLRVMDRCGVRMAVVSATRAISTEVMAGNAEVVTMARQHPGRFAGYAVFNPHEAGSLADVQRTLDEPGIIGIKIHPDVQAYSVNGPLYAPIFEYAAQRGVPMLTHTYADSPYSDPLQFDAIAAQWPSVVILLGHSGVTGEGHRRAMQVALKHPNLYLELCGSLTTGHWIQQMVATLGPERVMYGSDFPFIELRYALGRVVFSGLPPQALRLVLGGNAQRVLRLPAA